MRHVQLIVRNLVLAGLLVQGTASLAAKPVNVTLLPADSSVTFTVHSAKNMLSVKGESKGVKGSFKISGAKSVEGEATFPLSTLSTDMETRDKHMKEDLNVAVNPEAKFVPTSLPWEDPSAVLNKETKDAPFEGKLTLNNIERPVTGTVSSTVTGDKVEYTFNFVVKLEEHKLNRRTYLLVQVGNDVDVTVKTSAKVVAQ